MKECRKQCVSRYAALSWWGHELVDDNVLSDYGHSLHLESLLENCFVTMLRRQPIHDIR